MSGWMLSSRAEQISNERKRFEDTERPSHEAAITFRSFRRGLRQVFGLAGAANFDLLFY
jgi:hypothetical protein